MVHWLELPVQLRRDVAELLGHEVVSACRPSGSFGSQFAAVLALADGSSAFAKATRGPSGHLDDYRVELAVGQVMPAGIRTPRLRGNCHVGNLGQLLGHLSRVRKNTRRAAA